MAFPARFLCCVPNTIPQELPGNGAVLNHNNDLEEYGATSIGFVCSDTPDNAWRRPLWRSREFLVVTLA